MTPRSLFDSDLIFIEWPVSICSGFSEGLIFDGADFLVFAD
jgi:hypothetical protein